MIMVTFTKLFVISIVASSRSVSSNKFLIFSSEGCFPSSIEFKSDGESEKNAISEAEAKPEASKMAQNKLKRLGYTNVYTVYEGIGDALFFPIK